MAVIVTDDTVSCNDCGAIVPLTIVTTLQVKLEEAKAENARLMKYVSDEEADLQAANARLQADLNERNIDIIGADLVTDMAALKAENDSYKRLYGDIGEEEEYLLERNTRLTTELAVQAPLARRVVQALEILDNGVGKSELTVVCNVLRLALAAQGGEKGEGDDET